MDHEFTSRNIDITRNYAPNLPDILLDTVRIKQVFINLLRNAAEAIGESGTITIVTELANEFVDISIKDTGSGMVAEQIKEIFKPFYTTKKVGDGTGLSLSISLNIVESSGGVIDVQSQHGFGSTFTVSLPVLR
jgi:two-component system NtrC family sensor kinase